MAATASSILNDTHLQQINDALAKLDTADNEIQLALRAGLQNMPNGQQISQLEAQSKAARDTLLRIKNTYFPNSA